MAKTSSPTDFVQIGTMAGYTVVETDSPLSRLNYFDGKFLRGPDLRAEQQAMLTQVHLANQGGGGGLVHGFGVTQGSGDAITVTPGLGFDWQGRPLLLAQSVTMTVADLIAASTGSGLVAPGLTGTSDGGFGDCTLSAVPSGPDAVLDSARYYIITVHHTEAYCGEEDVFGKLCSEACIDGTQRSKIVEGVSFRASPVTLALKTSSLPFTGDHLRNRAASALFEAERQNIAALIGDQGIMSPVWCQPAEPLSGDGIPIALLGRSGAVTLFLDAWAARRERIGTPPDLYWSARLAMRSTRDFRAQVAQFQCQLLDCLEHAAKAPSVPEAGPCGPERALLREAADQMRQLLGYYASTSKLLPGATDLGTATATSVTTFDVEALAARIGVMEAAGQSVTTDRVLPDCGIVEIPSAGYLPVAPSESLPINAQVRRLLGPGVDLRFCAVRPDFVPHALEEAQHMERICLLTGIENPAQKPEIDILVPDGTLVEATHTSEGEGYRAEVALSDALLKLGQPPRKITEIEAASSEVTNLARVDTRAEEVANAAALARLTLSANRISRKPRLQITFGAARSDTAGERGGMVFALATQTGQNPDGFTPEVTIRNIDREINFWVDLNVDRDPFEASERTLIPISLRMFATGQKAKRAWSLERHLTGTLRVDTRAVKADGAQEAQGRLRLEGPFKFASGGQIQSDNVTLNADVALRQESKPGLPPSFTMVLSRLSIFSDLPGLELVFERHWSSASEQRSRLALRRAAPDIAVDVALTHAAAVNTSYQQQILMESRLTRDPAIFQPSNGWRSRALDAISSLAEQLNRPSFAETGAELLFPPPKPAQTETLIRAVKPWVLFHRRRNKECGLSHSDPNKPPALATRTYRVYRSPINDDAWRPAEIEQAVLEGRVDQLLKLFPPVPDGTVSFTEGLPAVDTPDNDIRSGWQSTLGSDSAELFFGLIASQGPVLEEGSALAETRLKGVTQVIEALSPLDQDFRMASLGAIPDSFGTSALDGVIVYFTWNLSSICHEVYRLATSKPDEVLTELEAYFGNPDRPLASALTRVGARSLGVQPRFRGLSPDYMTLNDKAHLSTAWNLAGGGKAIEARVMSAKTADSTQESLALQAATMAATTGSSLDLSASDHRRLRPGLLGECGHATLLLVGTECHSVALFLADGAVDAAAKQLAAQITQQGLPSDIFTGQPGWVSIGAVDFAPDGFDAEPNSLEEMARRWDNVAGSLSEQLAMISVAQKEADLETANARGKVLAEDLELNLIGHETLVHNEATQFPVACRAMTIIIANKRG